MIDWTEILGIIITTIFAPCLIAVVTQLFKLLGAKVKSEQLKTLLTDVETAVDSAVSFTAQTYVDDLKAKAADGKLTAEEQQEALSIAVNNAAAHLTQSTKDYLNKNGVLIEEYLKTKIEAAIGGTK